MSWISYRLREATSIFFEFNKWLNGHEVNSKAWNGVLKQVWSSGLKLKEELRYRGTVCLFSEFLGTIISSEFSWGRVVLHFLRFDNLINERFLFGRAMGEGLSTLSQWMDEWASSIPQIVDIDFFEEAIIIVDLTLAILQSFKTNGKISNLDAC